MSQPVILDIHFPLAMTVWSSVINVHGFYKDNFAGRRRVLVVFQVLASILAEKELLFKNNPSQESWKGAGETGNT